MRVAAGPGRGRVRRVAVAAGNPQHGAAPFGAEVLDIGADDLGDPGAGEQQHGDQRRGTGLPRARRRVGRVQEGQRLIPV